MKFFLDTADLNDISELASIGLVDGITTNPSIIAKSGADFKTRIAEICAVVPGPVSAEVVAHDYDTMRREADVLCAIAENVTIKVPMTFEGLKLCRALVDQGRMVNVTLCFSVAQALLAASAGATFISPFVGRLDDIGHVGIDLVGDIRTVYDQDPDLDTMILAASLRHVTHVVDAARAGADVATVPPAILRQMIAHPLTDKGIAAFTADWLKTGQVIV